MEGKLLDLGREAPFEYEEGEHETKPLCTHCVLEDLFMTSVPSTVHEDPI